MPLNPINQPEEVLSLQNQSGPESDGYEGALHIP